ncbi:MAG: hypothetical protein ABIH66_10980 [bacterium]
MPKIIFPEMRFCLALIFNFLSKNGDIAEAAPACVPKMLRRIIGGLFSPALRPTSFFYSPKIQSESLGFPFFPNRLRYVGTVLELYVRRTGKGGRQSDTETD